MLNEGKKCQFCTYSTTYISHLKEHVDAIHLKIQNFKCQQCEYATSCKRSLRQHKAKLNHKSIFKKTIHATVEGDWKKLSHKKIVKKSQSDSSSAHLSNVTKHKKLMHPKMIKDYKCKQCDYSSRWSSNVLKHMKVIHDKIRLQCENCKYSTTNHGVLKKHMINVHKKENPQKVSPNSLKCDHCDFTTRLKKQLTLHMSEAHSEQKKELVCQPKPSPIKCDESDFPPRICYNYKCDNCCYNASSEHELKLHIKAVHVKRENSSNSDQRVQDKINENNCQPCLDMKLKNLELEHQNAALKLKNLEVEQHNAALMRELSALKENFDAEKRLRMELEETLFISSRDCD